MRGGGGLMLLSMVSHRFDLTISQAWIEPILMAAVFCAVALVKLPVWLTALSFPIYMIHNLISDVVTGVYWILGIGSIGHLSFALCVVRFGIAFWASVIIALIVKRTMPRVSGVVFGGR